MDFFSQLIYALIYAITIQLVGQFDNWRRAAEHEAYTPWAQFISGFGQAQEVGYASYMDAFPQSTGNDSSHSTPNTILCQVFGIVDNDFDTANKAKWSCKFTEADRSTLSGQYFSLPIAPG